MGVLCSLGIRQVMCDELVTLIEDGEPAMLGGFT
jgi:hypothetical protein